MKSIAIRLTWTHTLFLAFSITVIGALFAILLGSMNLNHAWAQEISANAAEERFVFRNENSKLCMGVDRASTAPAAQIKQYECDCTANQQWTIDADNIVISGHRALVNVNSELCVGVDGGSTGADAAIMQFACDQRRNQQWAYEEQGTNSVGEMTIRFKNASGLCMGVDGASKSSDVQIKQFPCDGRNNQRWVVHSPEFCSL